MISKQWSVPRWSCHISIGATGGRAASIGTIDEYWLQTPTAVTSRGVVGVRGGDLADGVDEGGPHGLGVLFGDLARARCMASGRCALRDRRAVAP